MIHSNKLMFDRKALVELEKNWNFAQRFIDERCYQEDYKSIWTFFIMNPKIGLAIAKNYTQTDNTKRWKVYEHISKPVLTVLAAGAKGSGKTAFSHTCGEVLHDHYGLDMCMFRPLDFDPDLVPKWCYFTWDRDGIRPNSFVAYDEAQLTASSRRAMTTDNIDLSAFLTLQRHTGNPAMILQQVLAMTDLNVFRLADQFVFKKFGSLQYDAAKKSKDPLADFLTFLKPLATNELLFVTSSLDEIIFTTTPLCSYWSDNLSRPGKIIQTDTEAMNYARKLLKSGASLKQTKVLLDIRGHSLEMIDLKYLEQEIQGKKSISKTKSSQLR